MQFQWGQQQTGADTSGNTGVVFWTFPIAYSSECFTYSFVHRGSGAVGFYVMNVYNDGVYFRVGDIHGSFGIGWDVYMMSIWYNTNI